MCVRERECVFARERMCAKEIVCVTCAVCFGYFTSEIQSETVASSLNVTCTLMGFATLLDLVRKGVFERMGHPQCRA